MFRIFLQNDQYQYHVQACDETSSVQKIKLRFFCVIYRLGGNQALLLFVQKHGFFTKISVILPEPLKNRSGRTIDKAAGIFLKQTTSINEL